MPDRSESQVQGGRERRGESKKQLISLQEDKASLQGVAKQLRQELTVETWASDTTQGQHAQPRTRGQKMARQVLSAQETQ
jgi:hypothetical protein